MEKVKKVLKDISTDINWDNWEDCGATERMANGRTQHMSVLEVIWSQLENALDNMEEGIKMKHTKTPKVA